MAVVGGVVSGLIWFVV
jgi:hypothetical protein